MFCQAASGLLLRGLFALIFAIDITASGAGQDLLAFRAGDVCIGLIGAEMSFALARLKRTPTEFADQRLFAEAALHKAPPPARSGVRDQESGVRNQWLYLADS